MDRLTVGGAVLDRIEETVDTTFTAEGFFGPNFLLTAADPVGTPEPASLGLAGFGLVLVAAALRRTRQ